MYILYNNIINKLIGDIIFFGGICMSTIFVSNEQEMLFDLVNNGMTEEAAMEFMQNLDSEIDLGMETIIKLEHHYIVDGATAWYFKNEYGVNFVEITVGE
jgi:hypothetical protein